MILQTALAIVDRDGVDRLSMRRLSNAVGRDPVMLYRHVPQQGHILNELQEIIERPEETDHVLRLGLHRLESPNSLSWPEQQSARVSPILLMAHYGIGSHHPHLRGATVHDWPLNIFTRSDAAEQLSILRAIAAADLHNLVFEADYTIVPAVVRGRSFPEATGRT